MSADTTGGQCRLAPPWSRTGTQDPTTPAFLGPFFVSLIPLALVWDTGASRWVSLFPQVLLWHGYTHPYRKFSGVFWEFTRGNDDLVL